MTAYGVRRGLLTLAGLAGAAALLWAATLVNRHSTAGYWYAAGMLMGAGLCVVASQIAGGWTKDGRPAFSPTVFLLGFVPTLVVFGWVLVAAQPHSNTARSHILSWSRDIHVNGLVNDWRTFLPAVALLFGLAFALAFDTTGARVARPLAEEPPYEPAVADTPMTRERIAAGAPTEAPAVADGDAVTRVERRRIIVP